MKIIINVKKDNLIIKITDKSKNITFTKINKA